MTITLDFTNCLAEAIGATHGLTKPEVDTLVAKFPKHHESIDEMRANGESCFFDLPYQKIDELQALLKKHQGKWDNLVILGAGGAVATPRSLFRALAHRHHNELDPKVRKAPRVFFLANADPRAVDELLGAVDLKRTLFQLNSRSGTTAESVGVLLHLIETLKKKAGKGAPSAHILIVTEREKSPLNEIAKSEKIDTLPFPANLGGRWAVLGNPTLFMAGLIGLSIPDLLRGGAEMDKRCRHGDPYANPAYMHSLLHYLLTRKRRKTIHVTYPFSDRLGAVAQWYGHLVAVSLGKMNNRKGKAVHVGPSPEMGVGSFDLHGQQQLYAEGPFDKVVTFITVKDHGARIAIPASQPKLEAAAYLGGADLGLLLAHGQLGAEHHITASGRPNLALAVDQIDEAHVAGLYYLFMLSTVMSAELYGIDPFDQPGVEHGKHAIFAQFGRAGFEDLANRLKDYRAKPRRTC
jgi:glucose-6-phosphate isomerase